jgi:hypothetical protein
MEVGVMNREGFHDGREIVVVLQGLGGPCFEDATGIALRK